MSSECLSTNPPQHEDIPAVEFQNSLQTPGNINFFDASLHRHEHLAHPKLYYGCSAPFSGCRSSTFRIAVWFQWICWEIFKNFEKLGTLWNGHLKLNYIAKYWSESAPGQETPVQWTGNWPGSKARELKNRNQRNDGNELIMLPKIELAVPMLFSRWEMSPRDFESTSKGRMRWLTATTVSYLKWTSV